MDAQGLLWLALVLVAGVVELFTLSLIFAMVAGGALVAAVVAGVTGDAVASVIAFAVSTGLLLAVVRPPLMRYSSRIGAGTATGVAALVGRQAEVLVEVSAHAGEVKLAGETWSARSARVGDRLEVGSTVYVTRIDGATAVVSPSPPDGTQRDPHDPAALPGGDLPTDRPES
jgi:membrane protein implicated in regulation of membrane protease activity